jgi:hypothetical protein
VHDQPIDEATHFGDGERDQAVVGGQLFEKPLFEPYDPYEW